jgi:hypothetical protein
MEPERITARISELSCQEYDIGNALRQFGVAFASSYWKFEVKDDEIIGRMALPELQGVKPVVLPLAYLNRDTLVRLIQDIEATGVK